MPCDNGDDDQLVFRQAMARVAMMLAPPRRPPHPWLRRRDIRALERAIFQARRAWLRMLLETLLEAEPFRRTSRDRRNGTARDS